MAFFRSWDPFDQRTINFGEEFGVADEARFENDLNFEFRNVVYEDVLVLVFDTPDGLFEQGYYGRGIALNSAGDIVSGRISAAASWFFDARADDWFYNIAFTGFDVAATDFFAAQQTLSQADDKRLIAQMLRGNDTIILSSGADWANGLGGNDTIRGGAGKDTLYGGSGNDRIFGGSDSDQIRGGGGADLLNGGGGMDRLVGGNGDDTLLGGLGTDVLEGGRGNDRLTGGGGADSFVFARGMGRDTVTDFADGIDRIVLRGTGGAEPAMSITQVGDDVRILWANTTILLKDIARSQITSDDFDFL
jgi:Ca2+-binding RTX toxin-like protein